MATPMRSTDFRSIVAPILNQAFDGVYDQRADEYKAIFAESTGIARSYHEEPLLYGMGSAPQMPDGNPVTYDAGGQLYVKRYVYDQHAERSSTELRLAACCPEQQPASSA